MIRENTTDPGTILPVSTDTLDFIVNLVLFIFTGIDYILFVLIIYLMSKNKEKIKCY